MARLSELTDRSAVDAAVAEFRLLGRQAFLEKYDFAESKSYFAQVDDLLIDSKPLVAAIWAYQHPGRAPLSAADFSGGEAGAGAALRRLGLNLVTQAQLDPPRLGASYRDRTAIYDKYGGNKQAGIIRLPGDAFVSVFSDAEGPYADDPPAFAEPFGYRGEGLIGPHRVSAGGNALLEGARLSATPVRFWYRPKGEPFTFLTWVVVLGRTWVTGVGGDGEERPELDWQLDAVPGPTPTEWPPQVRESLNDAADNVENDPYVPEARPDATYAELVDRVEGRGPQRKPTGVMRTDYARSAAARRAVLLRCQGGCESPSCTGMPAERNRRGEPILDVDHIKDLALGGEDHPRNMAALCPNCHACKTRGANATKWRRELLRVVSIADAAALQASKERDRRSSFRDPHDQSGAAVSQVLPGGERSEDDASIA
jgi:5-methylcytosine-specific restriction protein A